MHHKFTLVDGKRLETGSFNYTNHAARANQENQIYLGDRNLVAQFHARFEDSWNAGKRFQGQ
jgi:cardiolipin hydrolase